MKEGTEDFAAAVHDGARRKNGPRSNVRTRMRANGDNALSVAIAYAEKRREFNAQHGTVRVIVKDGKPV